MARSSLLTTSSPRVSIEMIGGNLEVKGWDEAEVMIKGDEAGQPTLEGNREEVRIRCSGHLLARLPHNAHLQVESVDGSARVKMLEQPLKIQTVHGSLELRDVAQVQLERVHGNVLARQVAGGLQAGEILGNLMLRDVQGDCRLPKVHGNVELRDVEGDIELAADGNGRIRLSLLAGARHQVSVGGNLHYRIPDDASARVKLHSGAQAILVNLPEQRQNLHQADYELTLGEAEVELLLKADASIVFSSQEVSWSDDEMHGEIEDAFAGIAEDYSRQLNEQIVSQVESQMDILTEQMENLSGVLGRSGFSQEQAERILQQARAASERAGARAQEKMKRAQEKLERKLSAAREREEARTRAAERRAHENRRRAWSFEWSTPQAPRPPQPPQAKDNVSDEERLVILRMLEDKKITIEQAEKLLAALDSSTG